MGFVSMEGYDGPEPSRVGSQPLPGQDCGGDGADYIVWSSRSSRATESTEPLLQHNTTRPSRSDHTRRDHTSALQVLLLGILVIPIRGEAQITPLLLEVRGGAWIPTANLVGAQGFEGEASADVSFGVHFVLKSGLISYVAGFSEHRFGCTQVQCGEAVDFVSTAWDLGVRVNLRQAGIVPWVSLGASAALFAAHVETGNDVATEGSDRGWGYEAGAGVLVPLGGPFLVNPGVRYGRSDADFAARRTLETRYLIADIGLVLAF